MEFIGKYRIEEKIGEGAMGAVYRAWNPGFNDYVAVKTIQDKRVADPELLQRFELEARALAKLKHPNIVQVYDAEQAADVHFMVMEYMNGGTLERIISGRQNLPLAKRIGYVIPICLALDYAHKRRLFHRDIKPANIMLHHDGTEEIVKLVDFGIARLVDFSKTNTNMFMGTPAYMAPELLTAAEKANERTDIWSLGVTMYELITYRKPFTGKSLEELKFSIVNSIARPPQQIAPDCPSDLAAVVQKALEPNPSQRYQCAEDLLADLTPIAKRLNTEVAVQMVRRATELYEEGDIDNARVTLDQARKYDSTNTEIRVLLLRIQEEQRRKELLPQIQAHLRQARACLGSGAIRESEQATEAALALDPKFEPALRLLEEVRRAAHLEQEIEQKIRFTKQKLEEGELTQAESVLNEIERLDFGRAQVRELKLQIGEERNRRDKRKRINHIVNTAQMLLAGLEYDECLQLLRAGLEEFPGEPEMRKLHEVAQFEMEEVVRQRQKKEELRRIRELLLQQDFEGALARVGQLLREHPDDVTATNLKSIALDGAREQKQRKAVEAAMADLRELLTAGHLEDLVRKGESLLGDYPNEHEIRGLVDYAKRELDEREQKNSLNLRENQIRELISNGAFQQAELGAMQALEDFPNSEVFRSLLHDARAGRKAEEQRQRIADISRALAREEFGEADKQIKGCLAEGLFARGDIRLAQLEGDLAAARQKAEERREERRKTEREQALRQGRTLIKEEDFEGATDVLNRTLQEGLLKRGDPEAQRLEVEIGAARQQAEKRREEERRRQEQLKQNKRQEISAAIKSENFHLAIRLVDEFEQRFGSNEELSTLRAQAEQSFRAQEAVKQQRSQILGSVAGLLSAGDHRTADRLLRDNLDSQLLQISDPRVFILLTRCRDLEQQEKRLQDARLKAHRNVMQAETASRSEARNIETVASVSKHSAILAYVSGFRQLVRKPRIIGMAVAVALLLSISGLIYLSRSKSQPVTPVGRGRPEDRLKDEPQNITQTHANSQEAAQRDILDRADQLVRSKDLEGALQLLKTGNTLPGPLADEIQKKIKQVQDSLGDKNLRNLRDNEGVLWDQAKALEEQGSYEDAINKLNQVLAMGNGGVRKADARQEIQNINARLESQEQGREKLKSAQDALHSENFANARQAAVQAAQLGVNTADFLADLQKAENEYLQRQKTQLDRLRSMDTEQAIAELDTLKSALQKLANDTESTAAKEAMTYVNQDIPQAIAAVRGRIAKRAETSAFNELTGEFNRDKNSSDRKTLETLLSKLQNFASQGGEHSADIATYVNQITSRINDISKPAPTTPALAKQACGPDVQDAIEKYREANNNRDVEALNRVYPLPASEQAKFAESFLRARSIHMTVAIKQCTEDADGKSATLTALVQETYIWHDDVSLPVVRNGTITFYLTNTKGKWIIWRTDYGQLRTAP